MARRRNLTLQSIPKRAGFVAEPQLHPCLPQLAKQFFYRLRPVRDAAILPDLTAIATRGDRDRNRVLVHVQPDKCDTNDHDPSPMHEARHWSRQRNPRYLHH